MKKATAAARSCREGFNQRLLGYSATAGAALLLAPASHAQLSITSFSVNGGAFSPSPPSLAASNASAFINFIAATGSNNHVVNFSGSIRVVNYASRAAALLFGLPPAPGLPRDSVAGVGGFVFRLPNSFRIAGTQFGGGGLLAARNSIGTAGAGGFLPNGRSARASGYIGFKEIFGTYGWLRLEVRNDANGIPGAVTFVKAQDGLYGQFAYNTPATPSAIPEPANVASGLGLLALGAAGVREMRRRRKLEA